MMRGFECPIPNADRNKDCTSGDDCLGDPTSTPGKDGKIHGFCARLPHTSAREMRSETARIRREGRPPENWQAEFRCLDASPRL